MRCILNADDYGLTRSINRVILDLADNGQLDGVSILPNGYAFDEAVSEYRKRCGIRLAVHLNVFEVRLSVRPRRYRCS